MAVSRPNPIDNSFASGAYAHFESFLETKGRPSLVFVKIALANGEVFYCRGLWIDHLANVPGCVLIHGTPDSADEAMVVREDHIVHFEFSLKSFEKPPIGFSQN